MTLIHVPPKQEDIQLELFEINLEELSTHVRYEIFALQSFHRLPDF